VWIAQPDASVRGGGGPERVRRLIPALFACLSAWAGPWAAAEQPSSVFQLLKKDDEERTANFPEFVTILERVDKQRETLSTDEREYLLYLEAWRSGYEGDSQTALARLTSVINGSKNPTMRLRAGATVVNLLVFGKRYEEAFSRMSGVLDLLPNVSDGAARQQALGIAAELYNGVGQYDLSLSYSQQVIDTNWAGRGRCKGLQQKIQSLYDSGRLKTAAPELHIAMDECGKLGDVNYANGVRVEAAKAYVRENKVDDAINLLRQHYDEMKGTRNPYLIAQYDSVLADAYRRKGSPTLAQQFATDVVTHARDEFGEPLVVAFRVLYEVAKERGDFKAALEYHEQFAAADKAYLTDLSARHLAYQKINHENIANKLQVDALNRQNHVLQLERELSSKAVEASRLYIALLGMTVLFIGLWAYRTKRSQLHFQTLSRLDGLTGISNRPHFIETAERALEASRRSGEQLCIILCDLDHFKLINDKYGHATGDFVLKRTVAACKAHLTRHDLFGRFGGEEFAILLPSCGPEDARKRAEQLRAAIAAITAYQGTTKATVSASFGIATTSSSGHELGQLLAHADTALYEAKRMGRNRVVLHSSMGEIPALALVSTTGEFVQIATRSSGG
jgi:diguanylate cyclase (GGDEF)-like protein